VVGRTISHYKILSKLGEDGMGVVYKAEDTSLERTVALKFLASHLLGEAEAKARFMREAKAAAGLHHANICPVYEVGEAEGKTFLSMAFIEGESLEARIADGPLPLKEALNIGRQIAEGLDAAHEKGVIHRDVKPANTMVDSKGRATIMDFGLARLTEASRLTKADQTMGTVAYMSPEQAQGIEVDHRSDIWALGVVLYEMIRGQRPFQGEYDQALLYEIVHEEPEPLTGVRAGVPMELEFIVGKCLAKDRNDRPSSAEEIARDLRTLGEKLKSGRSTILRTTAGPLSAPPAAAAPAPVSEPSAQSKRFGWLPWALAACLAVCLVVVASVAWFSPSGEEASRRSVYRFTVQPPEGAVVGSFAVSPDGRRMVLLAEERNVIRLWLRSFDELSARPLYGTEGADPLGAPFWSPDSRYIGYFGDEKLKKVGIAGEPPMALADAPFGRGGAWGEDGVILFTPMNHGPQSHVFAISASGGEVRQVTAGQANSHRSPHFLPKGERFLFHAREGAQGSPGQLLVGELGSEETTALMPTLSNGVFLPLGDSSEGYLLTTQDNVLMAHPLNAAAGRLTDEPLAAVRGVGVNVSMSRGLFSVSPNGVLAYSDQTVPTGLSELTWVDRQGRPIATMGAPRVYLGIRISPDGSQAAFVTGDTGQGNRVQIVNFKDGSMLHPAPASPSWTATWAPDGESLLSSFGRRILRLSIDGAEPERVYGGPARAVARDYSPDGEWLLLEDFEARDSHNLLWMSANGETEPRPFLQTKSHMQWGRFSPDGKYVAYSSDESGVEEIYVRPFPEADTNLRVSIAGGSAPLWRRDGRELFFLSPEGNLVAAPIGPDASGILRSGTPKPLFPVRTIDTRRAVRFWAYDVAPDGERFLLIRPVEATAPTPIHVVVNWDLELARLAEERQASR